MKRVKGHLFKELTAYSPVRGIVAILSMSLIGWGMWVANPLVTTFANPIYDVMTVFATELAWGAIFIFAGANLLWGALKKSPEAVKRGAMIGWLLWILVSVMYGLAEPAATMVWTNFCLGLMHAWVYVQAAIHPELLVEQYDKERFHERSEQ